MPSVKVSNQATAANALTGLMFSKLLGPALISLFLSAVTVTDTVSFTIGQREVLRNANPNLETADVVDCAGRDQVLWAEPAMAGDELFMPVTATTAVNFCLAIDEL